ncbi:MAG: GNAT family N-acetyltransferase [Pseudomonadota bacterium]
MIQTTTPPDLTVETDRFSLRPVRKSDAGLMTLYAGDARVARMTTTIPHPLPPGAAEAFLGTVMAPNSDEKAWAIDGVAHGHGELLGLISLTRVTEEQSEVGYWIAPQFWNTGLASQALGALLTANPLGDRSFVASIFQDNPASARVVTHEGFRLVGTSEKFSVARGAIVPTWDYVRQLHEPRL